MKCPHCSAELKSVEKKGVIVDECASCGGMWLLKEKFDTLRGKEDRFIRWLDIPLWKEEDRHKLSTSSRACPSCARQLYSLDYHGHDVSLDICPSCKGVWLDKDEMAKMVRYMEDQITDETVKDFLKDIGHEAALLATARKDLATEMKDVSAIMKLLEYRIFSNFPLLSQLASRIPLT
jgi:Zn-finger nucleic acid-binding protein